MELSAQRWVPGGCREIVSWVVLVGMKDDPVKGTSASLWATYEAGAQVLLNQIPGGQSGFIYATQTVYYYGSMNHSSNSEMDKSFPR